MQQANRCNAVSSGKAGTVTVPLETAPDIVPTEPHERNVKED